MTPLVLVLCLLVPASLCAQVADPVPSMGTRIEMASTVLGEERTLWVWTPPGYSATGPALPVLYLLDADVHYRHTTALVQFLAYYLRAPEMIVVGVLNTARTRDFTPPSPGEEVSGNRGGADRFLRFLHQEVRPRIEASYRAAPFTVLVGHSLGGLFATHVAMTAPASFGAYIAISPSLDWADSVALRSARTALERRSPLPRFLHLSLSEHERPGIADATGKLVAALTSAEPAGLRWASTLLPGENHQTVPPTALREAFRWLFADWPIPLNGTATRITEQGSLAPFDEHYDRVSQTFGYRAQAPELAISMIGDALYRGQAWDLAIALFARRVALYPDSPEAHDELARTYLAAGRRTEALASFDRAVGLAAASGHPSLAAIRRRQERAREAPPRP